MIIAGIDPGLANLGYAFYDLKVRKFVHTGVISTRKLDKRLERYARDSNARRFRELWDELTSQWPTEWTPVAFVEGMSQPRDASASWKLALGWGATLGVCMSKGSLVVQIPPMDVKQLMTGDRKASKEEMISAVRRHFNYLTWPKKKALHEHMADAVAVVYAALQSKLDVIEGL